MKSSKQSDEEEKRAVLLLAGWRRAVFTDLVKPAATDPLYFNPNPEFEWWCRPHPFPYEHWTLEHAYAYVMANHEHNR